MANSPVLAARVNPALHRAVMNFAKTQNLSLTEALRELIESGLAAKKADF